MKKQSIIIVILFTLALGCATKPLHFPNLDSAKVAYKNLKKDEGINTNASAELFQAGKIYLLAENVKDQKEADHLTYMLLAQIEIAKEEAKAKKLLDKIESLKSAKMQAILDEKERELIILQKEAQKAKLEAKETRQKYEALQELNAQNTNRGLVLTLGDVLFETGRSELLPGSIRTIEKLAEFLKDNPKRLVLIEGHTDNVGSPTANLDLSLRRSAAVSEALSENGIVSERLFVRGYGEAYPVASNDDDGGRQRNRRVEIVILEEGVHPDDMVRD